MHFMHHSMDMWENLVLNRWIMKNDNIVDILFTIMQMKSVAALSNNYQIKFAILGSHLDITTKLKYRAITTYLHLPNPEIIKMFLYNPCLIMSADTPSVIYLLNKTPLAVRKATLSITQPSSSISIHSY